MTIENKKRVPALLLTAALGFPMVLGIFTNVPAYAAEEKPQAQSETNAEPEVIVADKVEQAQVTDAAKSAKADSAVTKKTITITKQTLQDVLVSTYQNNPEILGARAELRGVQEQLPQARAGWLPTLDATADYTSTNTRPESGDNDGSDPKTIGLELEQPLYTGGRTTAAYKQAEEQIAAQALILKAVEQDVFLKAITAFMDVLRDRKIVDLRGKNVTVLQSQLDATNSRFEVGEDTRTDVQQAIARLASARADKVAAEAALQASEATFLSVTGQAPQALNDAQLLQDIKVLVLPASLEDLQKTALSGNPTLLANQKFVSAADRGIQLQRGALLPTVTLFAGANRTYGVGGFGGGSSSNLNFTSGGDDDREDTLSAGTRFRMPLYEAGATTSRVRQAKQNRTQAEFERDTVQRQLVQSTTAIWNQLLSLQDVIAARREEVSANSLALEGGKDESSVGARTVLDVLDAEQEFLQAEVNLTSAQRDLQVSAYNTLALMGRLNTTELQLNIPSYDPAVYAEGVADSLWSLATE